MKLFTTLATAAAFATTATFALADTTWTSVADQSSVAFGSIKKDVVGEVHHFQKVSGTVSDAGAVTITIDLGSVETNIDIRNERMIEHVFKAVNPTATLSGEVDMDDVNAMAVGTTAIVDFEGTLTLAGPSSTEIAAMASTTACAVTAVPSWNFTPSRNVTRHVVGLACSMLSAKRGYNFMS
jgi:hypothetical protein